VHHLGYSTPMAEEDAELLDRARAGDGAAMEELLARHERQIYRFGLRMCGAEEEAREVLQETMLAAFRHLEGFRREGELSTWLYQLARSACLHGRRRRVGAPSSFDSLEGDEARAVTSDQPLPDARAHAKELGTLLSAAIASLPPAYREALILRDVEGLSAEEAAKVVGIDVRALKSRLHRARMEVREKLTAVLEGPNAAHECPELAEELSAYAGEDIDQATCLRIEDHMSRCDRCASACDALKKTVSLCRHLPGDAVPAPVRAAVRQALKGEMSKP
jgi:RNA polymerase sigma-70 factor (ECF subfamily)